MNSPLYSYFKNAYAKGSSTVTTKQTLKNAVVKGYLTEDEFKEITGDEYVI